MQRNYGFDNIKCILIFCVVLGHILELCSGFDMIYRMIYLFHMPVFMFITGFFAKSGWKGIADKAWTYVLFQALYGFFAKCVLGDNSSVDLVTPYWILWYLFVTVFYTALIPLYRSGTDKKRIVVLAVAVMLAVAAGFVQSIGYPLSLSRFLVFQPYFILGFYAREQGFSSLKKPQFYGILIGAFLSLSVAYLPFINTIQLYGSVGYENLLDVFTRLLLMVVGCIWIGALWGLKDRLTNKIPVISTVGKYTLPVYLLHGFFVRTEVWKNLPASQNILVILLITTVVCLVLGNLAVGTVVSHLSPFGWIKKKES